MKRTMVVFFALVGLVFLFDQVSRHLLGLDCIGPVLPAWGCVAQPYPGTFAAAGDLSASLLTYGGLVLVGVVLAVLVRDLVFTAFAVMLGRFRPDIMEKLAGEDEPKSYRIR